MTTKIYNDQINVNPLIANTLSYNNRRVASPTAVDGWYYLDTSGVYTIGYITDNFDSLGMKLYDCATTCKRYNLDSSKATDITITKLGGNRYKVDAWNSIYNFDSNIGKFVADINDDDTLRAIDTTFIPTVIKKVGNQDERFWSYDHRLQDLSTQFNSPQNFFEFVYNYYVSGKLSGFDNGGQADPTIPEANPFGLDYSQIQRAFGGKTRYEYDALYKQLRDTGVQRKYNIKKLIYWPKPGSAVGITEQQEASLRWYVNQQRYNFLAFVPVVPNEGKDNFAMLCPGNRVILKGTGTRLDDVPLKLAVDGFHTGPKPEKRFISDWQNDFWSLFTIRLPFLITPANNKIWYRPPGSPVDLLFEIPVGNHYLNDIFDYVNNNSDTFFFVLGSASNRMNLFAYAGVAVNSPNHPTNASTLFGNAGFGLSYLFPGNTIITPGNDRFILTAPSNDPTSKYNVHTPLTLSEITSLIDNMSDITVESTHGPVTNTMDYDNLFACILELSTAMCIEVHTVVGGWSRKSDSGMDELYVNMKQLIADLNANAPLFDPTENYQITFPTVGNMRALAVRLTGCGHPGEGSEMYTSGSYRDFDQDNNRGINRLEWIVPNADNLTSNKFFYPAGATMTVDSVVYSIAGREVESTIVNGLDDPKWLITEPDVDNKPTVGFLPYPLHENVYSGNPNKVTDSRVVDGEWIVGVFKDSWVRRALNLGPTAPVPKIGYITHYFSAVTLAGDPTNEPWYGDWGGATFVAAKVIRYFNERNVQHLIPDIRNVVGGSAALWDAICEHMGDDREFHYGFAVLKQNNFDPTGYDTYRDTRSLRRLGEDKGLYDYDYKEHAADCSPNALAQVFPEIELFRGPAPTNIPGMSTKRNVIWLTPSTNISATQDAYENMKGASIGWNRFDGDFGKNVQFIGYGCYDRPFSSGGAYDSYLNWYATNRQGGEECQLGLCSGIDRQEYSHIAYVTDDNVVHIGDDFSNLHETHIKWNMNMDIFFQDIGLH